jgi:hypothetical protein
MKTIKKENKELKRNHEIQGRDLINNNSMLDRIVLEETKMTVAFKRQKKY